MPIKKSVHFQDETIRIVQQYADKMGFNFNLACNVLLQKVGKAEIWRILRIEKLKNELKELEPVTP